MGTLGDGLLLGWADDIPVDVEIFTLGSVGFDSVEPFDIQGPKAFLASVEPFDLGGKAYFASVEPFDLGSKAMFVSVEPFDILGNTDMVLPSTDLGDGKPAASHGSPTYGWWSKDTTAPESIGTVVTD